MKYKSLFALAFAAVAFVGCDKETEGVTGITYYPVLNIEGEQTMVVDKGSSFVDPGYSAVLEGEDVTSQVTVSSNVDTNKSGVYNVSYKVTNADGFTSTVNRKVIVLDPENDIEGIYTVAEDSYRDMDGTITEYGGYEILVIDEEDGSYKFSDLIGGYYDQRAGYGSAYAMEAYIGIEDDNSVTAYDTYVAGWDDSADDVRGSYDASKKSFTLEVDYAGQMTFYITLTKN
ncbi:MAG: DUF5012 domain-containing protein [Bacteroidales bacterium]|nr:DUF5012 domain-containing protein [Bacteroidales bacterium]